MFATHRPEWTEAAFADASAFVNRYGDKPFTTEAVRQWVNETSRESTGAADGRAWGPVMQALQKEGIIRAMGIGLVTRRVHKKSRPSYGTLWVRA
jgi:hypothetical protein